MAREGDKPVSSWFDSNRVLFFDVETTTHNKGHPFDPRNFCVSYASCLDAAPISFKYFTDPDFKSAIRGDLGSCDVLVGFNIKFDIHWLSNLGITIPLHVKIWDCQLAEFIYAGQELPYDSLRSALDRYDLPSKLDIVKEYWDRGISTEHVPIQVLQEYNEWDVFTTKLLFDTQQNLLSDAQKTLTYLEGEDLRALQAAEYAGIKFDVDEATKQLASRNSTISHIESELSKFLPDGIPVGAYNFDSGDHLSALLYGATIGFDVAAETESVYKSGDKKGQPYIKRNWSVQEVIFPNRFTPIKDTTVSKCRKPEYKGPQFFQTDAPTLMQLALKAKGCNLQILQLLAQRSKEIKVVEMISAILSKIAEKGWQNNMIHGQFNQNVVITGRLSSSQPNLQNTPPEVDQLLVSRYES